MLVTIPDFEQRKGSRSPYPGVFKLADKEGHVTGQSRFR